jgi:divalent metal cation (Fe/Co/Zn/Cd) transporter
MERVWLMIVNTIVNIILVAAKAVAVIYSASISLTASLVDSVLDLLSTIIILGTSWAIGAQTDKHKVSHGHVCCHRTWLMGSIQPVRGDLSLLAS